MSFNTWSIRLRKVHEFAETRAWKVCAERGCECEGERGGVLEAISRGGGESSASRPDEEELHLDRR